VAACRKVAADPARRRELIEWAHRWCWPLGDEAADRGAELVRAAAAAGASAEPIWDAWDEPE
jgi:hypothetical protein